MLATAAPSNPPPPTNPHRRRTAPPMLHPIFQIARRNHREGRWSLSVNDARLWYDELPTSPLWASYMRKANEVSREMWAPSTWEQRMSLAGQFTTFCRTHEQPMNEESCAAFLMAIDVAPSTRLQYARMLGSMLEMNRTPLDMMIMGLQKNCGAIGDEAGAPLDKGRDESSNPQPDRLEGTCCLTTRVDNGESLVRDCGLDSQQFHTGAGRNFNFGLVRGAEDGKSGSPPRLAVREDTRARRFRHYKAMRDTSREGKAHESDDCSSRASFGSLEATAHSIKRGALRHAAQIVETYNLNPHVISQLAKHVDPFDLPQNTVRYLGRYTTLLTQVSSLVALM
ncbi:hypothetical protein TCDM_13705 [Trypanosoma cruzi Dm28c]|uniref:Uncharacterized protein n=1 Tax=Trypanosoma cruzi Dm28c TaxID=1416333 RepID=V5CHM9_TRYCR|nr:hypothetical protein TCDM_13705 [Trypanosoma cruzi Dm28c]